ncbi:PfkB family carbohydrate kinase [Aliihoeflea sp. 40Bstr573]|uniref:PfkB family carbohydrate kinase n=1 Tax=Aliihoeflea sp. 40Bstr573 TaxID=2696467 RepID=UPI0020962578|nr:PfkB family carbohydrate kinase [Aliihoeflea sp. 40Bstr573]MCO6388448.1 sugar kinase [Aliihoeflea sp. 40Bstr573]
MSDIFFIGIAVVDYIFLVDRLPDRAEKYRARDLQIVGGGLAANAAVTAARLGHSAHMIGRIGDDVVAGQIGEGLAAEGVDCAGLRRFAGHRSPLSSVYVDDAGERMIVNYGDWSIPTATDWLPDELPAGTGAVMGDIRWEEGARHLFDLARGAGLPAVLDVDRPPFDASLLDAASHVALSAQALREMTGTADPRAGLTRLRERCAAHLSVTIGAEGTLFFEGDAIAHEPAYAVDVVDTLGAGDVWHGALTVALAEGMETRAAIRFASAAAALKCTRFGGRAGIPTRVELDQFLNRCEGSQA